MKRKIETGEIVVWIILLLVVGGLLWGMNHYITDTRDKYNICAVEYGYPKTSIWSWEGTDNMNYSYEYLNSTAIACCRKGAFLDTNGQIQKQRCTEVHNLE